MYLVQDSYSGNNDVDNITTSRHHVYIKLDNTTPQQALLLRLEEKLFQLEKSIICESLRIIIKSQRNRNN